MTNTHESLLEAEKLAFSWVEGDATGHDRFHIERVRSMALRLADTYGADKQIVGWAALFHDAFDSKFVQNPSDRERSVQNVMRNAGLGDSQVRQIWQIIRGQSFSESLTGAIGKDNPTLEFQVVQDADRLDALGAIGIARCFAYGGYKGQPIHHPDWAPRNQLTLAEYRQGVQSSLNHFHEKLLLLRDKMHTPLAREIATERHQRMHVFLMDFAKEWSGQS